ncbi:MAG TPA: methyltransferase domain-containing protein [Acidimicrobiia bacterium]|jgi:ubiquinone/menaquinone biosynthesis C-methylase UbiE|nr:methyltransferase domain-containing protein [Acidimicrobiia bacterium]
MTQLSFDAATAKALERAYHKRDMLRRRRHVRAALAAQPGERILDVGCGPGFYAQELLDEVGPDGSIVAVDASADMLALARHRCEGHDNVTFREGNASALPIDDGDVDAALCVQVMEYVPDPPGALAEIYRALRPGGRALIWDVDWGTIWWHTEDPDRMRRVLSAWDEHLVHPSLPRRLGAYLRGAGFVDVTVAGHSFATVDYDDESFAILMLGMAADFVPGRGDVTGDEAAAWLAEQRDLAERGEFFFEGTQFCFTARKPASQAVA